MDRLPDYYIDTMPCDESLLLELGRVNWAAARLHAAVRDAINVLDGTASDAPFSETLGAAIAQLRRRALSTGQTAIVEWVDNIGRPAKDERNAVIHAVTYTAADGRQAIMTHNRSHPGRFENTDLRDVTRSLIAASMSLPRPYPAG